jgi:hypothetical protein
MQTQCLFCGNRVQFVFVHGHYQCPVCNTNALPCCDGDNCNNTYINVQPPSSNEIQPVAGQNKKDPGDPVKQQ